jgi:hypothetical protein
VLGGVDCATGVIAEGSALGRQGEAAEGVPRHGTRRPGVRYSVSSVPGGVTVCAIRCDCLRGVHWAVMERQLWGAEC